MRTSESIPSHNVQWSWISWKRIWVYEKILDVPCHDRIANNNDHNELQLTFQCCWEICTKKSRVWKISKIVLTSSGYWYRYPLFIMIQCKTRLLFMIEKCYNKLFIWLLLCYLLREKEFIVIVLVVKKFIFYLKSERLMRSMYKALWFKWNFFETTTTTTHKRIWQFTICHTCNAVCTLLYIAKGRGVKKG